MTKPPQKTGRKEWIPTPDEIKQVEALKGRGLTHDQVADCLGIARSTLYDKATTNKDLSDALKRGKAKTVAMMASKLVELGYKKENVTALIFYLKTQAGWKEQVDVNLIPKPTIIKRFNSEEEIVLGTDSKENENDT